MSSVGGTSQSGLLCGLWQGHLFGWPKSDTVTTFGASWLKDGTLCCVGLESDLAFVCHFGICSYSSSDFINLVFSSFYPLIYDRYPPAC